MLDSLEKDLAKNKQIVQKANQELFTAAETSTKAKKGSWMCLLLLFVLIAGVVVFCLFQLGLFDGTTPN